MPPLEKMIVRDDLSSLDAPSITSDVPKSSIGVKKRQKKFEWSGFNFIKVLGKGSFGKVRMNSLIFKVLC